MTHFRFDHVGFLTADVDYSFGVYRALGCEVTERTYRRGCHDVAYGGAGTDVLLEFQGPPLLAESEEYLRNQPWSIERVALVCEDAEAAYARLMAAGVPSSTASWASAQRSGSRVSPSSVLRSASHSRPATPSSGST